MLRCCQAASSDAAAGSGSGSCVGVGGGVGQWAVGMAAARCSVDYRSAANCPRSAAGAVNLVRCGCRCRCRCGCAAVAVVGAVPSPWSRFRVGNTTPSTRAAYRLGLCCPRCLRYNRSMNFGESFLAGTTVLVCLVLLLRLTLGPARQQRFDRTARRWGWRIRSAAMACWATRSRVAALWRQVRHGPAARRHAKRAAADAIERARGGRGPQAGDWRGNVYTPKSFRKSPAPGVPESGPAMPKPTDPAPPPPPVPPHTLH